MIKKIYQYYGCSKKRSYLLISSKDKGSGAFLL